MTTITATGKRWRRRPSNQPPSTFTHPGLPDLVQRVLCARGLASGDAAERFLRAELGPEHNPLLLPDAEKALTRIAAAIRADEVIGVFGDYDVDGVTATAILVEGISALAGRAIPRLPNRFTEGYGVSKGALRELRDKGASLVITTDCGISAFDEIDFANEIGLDVIVFDHHSIPERLPDALALVDPKLDGCEYPCTELAACGISFKMLTALADHLGRPYDPEAHLDLVALGTVCDMAPLEGENRYLVRRGLRSLRKTARPGLWALAEVGRFDLRNADADTLGFYVGPRLNAAGRMANAAVAYELLTTRDEARARTLAHQLNGLNAERQKATTEAVYLAGRIMEDHDANEPLIMLGHKDIAQGVVGLVAGRLADQFYRPAMVYQFVDGKCKGSARGIPEFDVVKALTVVAPLMDHYGGHRQAGGFTFAIEREAEVRDRITHYAREQLDGADLTPVLDYDDEIDLAAIDERTLKWLPYLEPYGQGNPEPVLVARGLTVAESKPVGKDGTHLRLRLRAGDSIWTGIAFRLASAAPRPGERIDAAFALRSDARGRPDLHVRDYALNPL